jgi:hypothetical protein
MDGPVVATVLNFCSNEARFLKSCIEQCRIFSRQIVIPVCDHLFDGTPENRDFLQQVYAAFPDCQFIEYPFISQPLSERRRNKATVAHFWPCVSRLVGTQYLNDDVEQVLYLDVDEIPDGKRFSEWLKSGDCAQHSGLRLAGYWYFREARYQALNWEDTAMVVRRRLLDDSALLSEDERGAIYHSIPGPKRRVATHPDGYPMFHHYSWVRTKEEMLVKVRAWGHRADRDWERLVEQEFSQPFSGKDFVHGYSFQECSPQFSISLQPPQFVADSVGKTQVSVLTERELLKIVSRGRNDWLGRLCSYFR